MRRILGVACIAVLLTFVAHGKAQADEGMWTFDNFPSSKVADAYGFKPDQAWLDKVRLSSVRLAFGCSGSFISPSGLVMTNHHCAQDCITQLSAGGKDYNHVGFYAESPAEEKRCPAIEVNQLIKIDDVTDRMKHAEHGLAGAAANDAVKAETARVTAECDKALRCDVVTLYNGGQYKLYTYQPYRDVRLVFAPEFDIAFFGGDPDNFNFPRYDLDIALLRVYENGKPLATSNYFGWNPAGPKDGELTFVSGNPGNTSRLDTVAQIQLRRDAIYPFFIPLLSEFDGYLTRYAMENEAHRKQALDDIFFGENDLKALTGRQQELLSPSFFAIKQKQEDDFRAGLAADPAKQAKYGAAWDNIAKAQRLYAQISVPRDNFREQAYSDFSDLLDHARTLVREADELPKKNDKRLPEYADARLATLQVALFSPAPIYAEYEKAKLTWCFTKLRQYLTADDSFVRKVLGTRSPQELASLIATSKLTDPALRKALWKGGKAAIKASTDPAIVLMRNTDLDTRAARKYFEDNVEAPTRLNKELIGEAQFALYGTSVYPDATFTARLSYGSVKGYPEGTRLVEPFTHFWGLYARATGRDPFKLPARWLGEKKSLDLQTPMNFVSTHDIIGGNSGSPVIDKDAKIVGLIFDGNIHSLGGDYVYDGAINRAISVDSAGHHVGPSKRLSRGPDTEGARSLGKPAL